MNLVHLKYAVEVEKTGSISKAADNLYMGQPNLSKAIKDLEETLGFAVFKRSAKGMYPTSRGIEFLGYAKNILAEIDEIESISKSYKKNKFSASVPRAEYIKKAILSFARRIASAKEMDVTFREAEAMHAVNNIIHGIDSFAIIRYPHAYERYYTNLFNEKGIMYETIMSYEPCAVVCGNHPLAEAGEVHAAELAEYTEIINGDNAAHSTVVPDVRRLNHSSKGKKTITLTEGGDRFALLKALPESAYMLTSPMPEDMLAEMSMKQIRVNGINQTQQDVLVHTKKLRDLEKKFIDEVVKIVSSIKQQ